MYGKTDSEQSAAAPLEVSLSLFLVHSKRAYMYVLSNVPLARSSVSTRAAEN